jgi:hypothetical protein
MNKYILFAGERYYPKGGCDDFVGFFDSIDEAKENYDHEKFDDGWCDIVEADSFKKVSCFYSGMWEDK